VTTILPPPDARGSVFNRPAHGEALVLCPPLSRLVVNAADRPGLKHSRSTAHQGQP
jgi:hypothetical protein